MKNTRMRLLVNDVLWRTLVHVGMGLELEHQVEDVDQKQDHTDTAADFKNVEICIGIMSLVEGSVESRLYIC